MPLRPVDLVELDQRFADADNIEVAHGVSGCCAAGRGW
jgi:hypothetical protein